MDTDTDSLHARLDRIENELEALRRMADQLRNSKLDSDELPEKRRGLDGKIRPAN
jgi:hypothetical protein